MPELEQDAPDDIPSSDGIAIAVPIMAWADLELTGGFPFGGSAPLAIFVKLLCAQAPLPSRKRIRQKKVNHCLMINWIGVIRSRPGPNKTSEAGGVQQRQKCLSSPTPSSRFCITARMNSMPQIYENIAITLDSADKNVKTLLTEYKKSLGAKSVSAELTDLTHQICTQLRSTLDRIAYRCWNRHVAPGLSERERNAAKSRIYFPGAVSQASFDSTLGTWRLKQADHPDLHSYLLAQQPFRSARNNWLAILFDLAAQGKHIDLVPQKKIEERHITVSRPGSGSVSWGPGVTFGGGVSVMGAPINPATQRIVPTPGVTERIDNWVSFIIDGHNVNAAGFCKEAASETRRIVQEMTDKYGLS